MVFMTDVRQVPTILVCGFLGAGKTTFLKGRLTEGGPRTAVLVNDFGDLGMDGGTIRAAGGADDLQVVEMAGGCICCSDRLALADTVRRLISDHRPERLFIEPSGIAEASELIRILQGPGLIDIVRLDCVVCVVDAETFLPYSEPEAFGTFFLDQISGGDIIVVNKEDLVPGEVLEEVESRLRALNPSALIVPADHGRLAMELPVRGERSVAGGAGVTATWEYFCFALGRPLPARALDNLSRRLTSGEYGTVMRAKGIIAVEGGERIELQLVGGRATFSATSSAVSPRFSCVGFGLDRERLAAFFSAEFFSFGGAA